LPTIWVPRAITPDRVLERVRLRLHRGQIAEIHRDVEPAPGDERIYGATLLPGLVDLQVNGGDGASYAAVDASERARATQYHVSRGTTTLLATLVTAELVELAAALERLADDVAESGPVVGVHLEGPFLAQAKSGAHAADRLCDPTAEAVELLLEKAGGTLRMLTLAPELDGALAAVERLVRAGVVVAAGHSLATLVELRRAIDAGLSFVTHLGNASDWPSRPYDPEVGFRRSEPGVIGTFLLEERLMGSLILDGFHLHPELARALVRLRGPDHLALVSDATAAAGRPPGRYRVEGLDVEVREGGYAVAGQGLAGSVITLLDAVRVAVESAGVPLQDAVAMATATPARLLGIECRKGALIPGADADLLLVDADWRVRRVYLGGVSVGAADFAG
jgi:N-acetylglucosamine-6-phosphate deacetylase